MSKLNAFNKKADRKNINAIKWERLNEYKENGKEEMLPFWIADSDYPTDTPVIKGLIERVKNGTFGYTSIDDDYLNTLKVWFKKRYDYNIEKDWVVTSPGVVTALFFAVELFTNKNDEVIVQPPVYNPFYNVVNNNGRTLVYNKLLCKNNKYVMDYVDLEKKLQTGIKMMIMCNPHNPIGRVYKYEEVEKVVNLCKKYDCLLVSDEIHCDLILDKNVFTSAGKFFDVYDKIIVCTAPSKTFNLAGLETSNIIIKNPEIRKAYAESFKKRSLDVPNLLGLEACKLAYKNSENWLENQLVHLSKNAKLVYKFFKENIPSAKVVKPEGTYLMWIDLRYLNIPSSQIVSELIKYNVLVNNGYVYGTDYDGFIRLNIACPKTQLEEGLIRIKDCLNNIK